MMCIEMGASFKPQQVLNCYWQHVYRKTLMIVSLLLVHKCPWPIKL